MISKALKHLKRVFLASTVVESNAFTVTSYVKGVAILAVAALHYTGAYLTDNTLLSANRVVSVFFVLSGYGLFYSLNKRSRENCEWMGWTTLLRFWADRAVRILPLLWVALLLDSLLGGRRYSPADFFGNPVGVCPFIYWFVSYILQCYLVAPFLWILLRRIGWKRYVVLVLALLAMTCIFAATRFADVIVYQYHGLFLGHVILFALGMAIPMMVSARKAAWANRFTLFMALASFLLIMILSLPAVSLLSTLKGYMAPLFLLSAFALCLSAIWTNQRLPFAGILSLVGTYSYPLYMFHIVFYLALQEAGVVKAGSLASVLYVVILFPAFFFVCMVAEKTATKGADYVVASVSRCFRRVA
jgi:peptidoglycan/LPS O-acetylase OafA/YrhL